MRRTLMFNFLCVAGHRSPLYALKPRVSPASLEVCDIVIPAVATSSAVGESASGGPRLMKEPQIQNH